MSRRSKTRRVTPDNANRRLPVSGTPVWSPYVTPVPYLNYLRFYEDRRQWSPTNRPFKSGPSYNISDAKQFSTPRHSLRVPTVKKQQNIKGSSYRSMRKMWDTPTYQIGFQNPSRTLICVRRRIRKEIMFAKNKAGKKGQRRPRFNYYSKITCRR